MYSILNQQILAFQIQEELQVEISQWVDFLNQAEDYLDTYPKL